MSAPIEETPFEKYKKRGNDLHAAKNYKEAVKQYSKALEHAKTDEERGTIRSNRSASLLLLNKVEDALADAEETIRLRYVRSYGLVCDVPLAVRDICTFFTDRSG
jgi:tetratricopeptide (TPR) repeat protein